jgi:hypothetical protein
MKVVGEHIRGAYDYIEKTESIDVFGPAHRRPAWDVASGRAPGNAPAGHADPRGWLRAHDRQLAQELAWSVPRVPLLTRQLGLGRAPARLPHTSSTGKRSHALVRCPESLSWSVKRPAQQVGRSRGTTRPTRRQNRQLDGQGPSSDGCDHRD